MEIENSRGEASFRDHLLRELQSKFTGKVPKIVARWYRKGWLDGTVIDGVLSGGGGLHPDDITLTGLQLNVGSSKSLVHGVGKASIRHYFLGQLCDLGDGLLARDLGLSSPFGAVKDVVADRLADISIAQTIAEARRQYKGGDPDLEEKLIVAFQLSTLTKAFSEMLGVSTSEGGLGSMIERRLILFGVLYGLGRLSEITNDSNQRNRNGDGILSIIDKGINNLIFNSDQGARERAGYILRYQDMGVNWEEREELYEPDSPAAVEARKYAVVVLMNRQNEFDIIGCLNNLTDGVEFPSAEELISRLDYVGESVESAGDFMAQAISIANLGQISEDV